MGTTIQTEFVFDVFQMYPDESNTLCTAEPVAASITGSNVAIIVDNTPVVPTVTGNAVSFLVTFDTPWQTKLLDVTITINEWNTYHQQFYIQGIDLTQQVHDFQKPLHIYMVKNYYDLVIDGETVQKKLAYASVFGMRRPLTNDIYLYKNNSSEGVQYLYNIYLDELQQEATKLLSTNVFCSEAESKFSSVTVLTTKITNDCCGSNEEVSICSSAQFTIGAVNWLPEITSSITGTCTDEDKNIVSLLEDINRYQIITNFATVSKVFRNGVLKYLYDEFHLSYHQVSVTDEVKHESDIIEVLINDAPPTVTNIPELNESNQDVSHYVYDDDPDNTFFEFDFINELDFDVEGDWNLRWFFKIPDNTFSELDTSEQYIVQFSDFAVVTAYNWLKLQVESINKVKMNNITASLTTVVIDRLEKTSWKNVMRIILDPCEQVVLEHPTDGVYRYTVSRDEESHVFVLPLYGNIEQCLYQKFIEAELQPTLDDVEYYKTGLLQFNIHNIALLTTKFINTNYSINYLDDETTEILYTISDLIDQSISKVCTSCITVKPINKLCCTNN